MTSQHAAERGVLVGRSIGLEYTTLGWNVVGVPLLVVSAVGTALVMTWVVLLAILWRSRSVDTTIADSLRLIPDVIRLTRRLAADKTLPRSLRVRLWILLGYLLSPIDLVPDFIPVIGYADDAIVVLLVLRSVLRVAGDEAITKHWPGTDEHLRTVLRLAGSPRDRSASPP